MANTFPGGDDDTELVRGRHNMRAGVWQEGETARTG